MASRNHLWVLSATVLTALVLTATASAAEPFRRSSSGSGVVTTAGGFDGYTGCGIPNLHISYDNQRISILLDAAANLTRHQERETVTFTNPATGASVTLHESLHRVIGPHPSLPVGPYDIPITDSGSVIITAARGGVLLRETGTRSYLVPVSNFGDTGFPVLLEEHGQFRPVDWAQSGLPYVFLAPVLVDKYLWYCDVLIPALT